MDLCLLMTMLNGEMKMMVGKDDVDWERRRSWW